MPALTKVNTRAALGGNDFVNWGVDSAGSVVTEFSTLPSSYVSQTHGIVVTIDSFSSFQRRTQGVGNSWPGNLSDGIAVDGDAVAVSTNARKFIRINVGTVVKAVGMQVQTRHDLADPRYKVTLRAFDASDKLLTSSNSRSGNNNNAEAVFVGLSGGANLIKRIELEVTNNSGQAVQFAINRLELFV